MDLYRLNVAAHIFLSIVLVGFALFWTIMYVSLGRQFDAREVGRLMGIVQGARWPHVFVPFAWRLRLPWLVWFTLIALLVTGVVSTMLRGLPTGILWWTKIGCFAAVIACQALLVRRMNQSLVRVNLLLVLTLVVVSGWVIR